MKYYIATIVIMFSSFFSIGQQTNETLNVGTEARTYVQYLPTGFDPMTENLPVIFCLHGIGDVATNMANIGFNQIADTARFIVYYPQGIANGFGQNSWNNGTAFLSSTSDDMGFINQLMDTAILNYNADPTRVYVSGFSMGGIMSHHLACNLNERVAAIGSMSGSMSTADMTNCVPTYLTPVIHFHGTADATVPYDTGALPSLSLATETEVFWRDAHSCLTTKDSTRITDVAADGYTVDQLVYQGCSPNASFEFWRVNGADHEFFYEPVNDFTETIEIWRFFSQWSHSNPAPAGIQDLANDSFKIIGNPINEKVEILTSSALNIQLWDNLGNKIGNFDLAPGSNTIILDEIAPGVYFFTNGNNSKRVVKL